MSSYALGCGTDHGLVQESGTYVFRDKGRVFLAVITHSPQASADQLGLAPRVLDTLRISRNRTTTTHLNREDRRAIQRAVLGWLNNRPRDAVSQYVEDYQHIVTAIRAAAASAPPNRADYTGRVDDITNAGHNEAILHYSIIDKGQVLVGPLEGRALKIKVFPDEDDLPSADSVRGALEG
jgi:hypothetical protein